MSFLLLVINVLFSIFALDCFLAPTLIECDKSNNSCVRKKRHFWTSLVKEEKLCNLSDIKEAKLIHYVSGGNTANLIYHTALELNNGNSIQLTYGSSSKKRNEKQTEAINCFLKSEQQKFTTEQSGFSGNVALFFFIVSLVAFGMQILLLF